MRVTFLAKGDCSIFRVEMKSALELGDVCSNFDSRIKAVVIITNAGAFFVTRSGAEINRHRGTS